MNQFAKNSVAAAALALLMSMQVHAAAPRFAVLDRISGPDGAWDYTTVDAAARRLYLARDDGAMAMNLETRRITPVLVAGAGVHTVLPVGNSGLLLLTNGRKNTATVYDTTAGKIVHTVPVGQGPDAAAYDPHSHFVAVMNHRGGTVSVVDAAQGKVVRTIPVGGELEFAAASGDGKLFVNVASKGEVAVLDLMAGTVLKRVVMKGCEDPSGLAYDVEAGLVASVCGNGVTKILRGSDLSEVASLKTGAGSDALILDAARHLLFVPAGRDGTLAVVSLEKDKAPTVLQTLKTGEGARLGQLDPKTGRIYLPSAKQGPPKPGSHWPSDVPGTFVLLVVGTQ